MTLPVGTTVSVPTAPVNQDENIYKNGSEFDGFRFYRMREEEGDTAKTYCVNTNHNFLSFGHGTHAWYDRLSHITYRSPGRFFAVNEVKLMLAFFLLRYDFKTENAVRPKDWEFQSQIIPDMSAKILIRRRRSTTIGEK